MSKFVFWVVSFVYSVIYVFTETSVPHGFAQVFGSIIGAWIWLGLLAYGVTHIGKGKNNSSRNTIAFIISTILFGMVLFANLSARKFANPTYSHDFTQLQSTTPQIAEDIATEAVEFLEKNNALYALLMQKNDSFKEQMKQTMKSISSNSALRRKWQETHSFDISDIENAPSLTALLENEFAKYTRTASDTDIYDMYKTEYAHMVKYNCKVYPLAEDDRQETIRVKSRLVNNSISKPYKGKIMSDNDLAQAFKQIGKYYAQKGNDPALLMRFLEGDRTLSKNQQCAAAKGFYEAILSLPKSTSAGVVRTLSK